MKRAPAFRNIYKRYPEKELETVILQGAVSHYRDMPQIQFSLEDVSAIMAYLASLDAKSGTRE